MLLGPLPAEAVPRREPLAPPEVLAGPDGWAIAGWERLMLYLYAGPAGSRSCLVILDANGTLLSASDAVYYRMGLHGAPPPEDCEAPALIRQESVGGRFELDGSFRGTRWVSTAVDHGEEELEWNSTPSEPSVADIAALRWLVAELRRRQP